MTTKKTAGKTPAKARADAKPSEALEADADPGLGLDDQAATPDAEPALDDTAKGGPPHPNDDTSESTAAADADHAPAVAPASGVGRYRVIKTGEEIRLANARAAARVADGELERV